MGGIAQKIVCFVFSSFPCFPCKQGFLLSVSAHLWRIFGNEHPVCKESQVKLVFISLPVYLLTLRALCLFVQFVSLFPAAGICVSVWRIFGAYLQTSNPCFCTREKVGKPASVCRYVSRFALCRGHLNWIRIAHRVCVKR